MAVQHPLRERNLSKSLSDTLISSRVREECRSKSLPKTRRLVRAAVALILWLGMSHAQASKAESC